VCRAGRKSGLPHGIALAVHHEDRGAFAFAARQGKEESGGRMTSTKQRRGSFPAILIA
jgi:hypothetical protein